ncbi:MAG: DUF3422 domain-containing protein [Xanthobacteraceae bacterium]
MVSSDHPQRFELNNEVHARPPEALTAPVRISYIALFSPWSQRELEQQGVTELARRFGAPAPWPDANHFSADLGPFRLVWERHTEFARYTIIAPCTEDDPFAEPALSLVPAKWVETRPGKVIVAAHAALVNRGSAPPEPDQLSARLFEGNALVGAAVSGGAGTAFTDFRVKGDGFSRILVHNHNMAPLEAGRMVQRLLEIDTYRMLALLALPIARALAPSLGAHEHELANITEALVNAKEDDEPMLLDRLTRLAAEIDSRAAAHHFRFSAAMAYYDLVQRRIAELREQRIQGLQTFREFTERRLAPAMATCRAVADRQDALSRRVARATQLLSTRVDIARERQNREVLDSMNRRAKLQLRLQSTVEGLSVAAVTYYVVGLIGYAAKGLSHTGLALSPELVMAASIPFVAAFVWLGLRSLRRSVTTEDE